MIWLPLYCFPCNVCQGAAFSPCFLNYIIFTLLQALATVEAYIECAIAADWAIDAICSSTSNIEYQRGNKYGRVYKMCIRGMKKKLTKKQLGHKYLGVYVCHSLSDKNHFLSHSYVVQYHNWTELPPCVKQFSAISSIT